MSDESRVVDPGAEAEAEPANKILARMLERLFAALVNGPSLNCRPHNSRQRVDFAHVQRLGDIAPPEALAELLGGRRKATIKAQHPAPRPRDATAGKGSGTGQAAGAG